MIRFWNARASGRQYRNDRFPQRDGKFLRYKTGYSERKRILSNTPPPLAARAWDQTSSRHKWDARLLLATTARRTFLTWELISNRLLEPFVINPAVLVYTECRFSSFQWIRGLSNNYAPQRMLSMCNYAHFRSGFLRVTLWFGRTIWMPTWSLASLCSDIWWEGIGLVTTTTTLKRL